MTVKIFKCLKCGSVITIDMIQYDNLPVDMVCGGIVRGIAHPSIPNKNHFFEWIEKPCGGKLIELKEREKNELGY